MNENNPQNNDSQKNNIESEFKMISFTELIETLYENKELKVIEKMKKEIEKGLKKKIMRAPHISHLYLGISRIAADFLVKYKDQRENLEKRYFNLLELISETLKLTPEFPKKDNSEIDGNIREIETLHLWKNRELLNDAMGHYVREIQRLRDKKHRQRTLWLSILAIGFSGISILISVILRINFP